MYPIYDSFDSDYFVVCFTRTRPLYHAPLFQAKEIEQYSTSSKKFWSHLHHVDYKLLLIPVVFVFLRIWSVIQSILYDYIGLHVAQVNPHLIQALLYLSVSTVHERIGSREMNEFVDINTSYSANIPHTAWYGKAEFCTSRLVVNNS